MLGFESCRIGIGSFRLRARHARSLKDRRRVSQGLVQKLRNRGFSVVEMPGENPQAIEIAYSFVGSDTAQVSDALKTVRPMLIGEFEVMGASHSIVDYPAETLWEPSAPLAPEWDPEEGP